MPREANAIDFWRGFALVSIFVNHIPGIWYERLTHRNLSISDSAELFVFLAGWSLGLLVGRSDAQKDISVLGFRLGGRAVQIYAAHILISALALALLAITAFATENPLILEWHNASAFFLDPAHVQIGIVLLTHQLGYFDILPLYVVFMLAAPAFAVIDRLARPLLLPLSLALYFAALTVPFTATTWPVEGQWFFNPFTWQAIFVLGFALSRDEGLGVNCAAQHHPDPVCCGACRGDQRDPCVVQLVSRSDQTARAAPAVPQRQEFPHSDAPPAVSGPGGGVLGGLPSYCAPTLASGISVYSRAQFSSRVLCGIVAKLKRTNRSFPLLGLIGC